jgi:hypothetical protein
MTEDTAMADQSLAQDPRAAKLLETWQQLDERYQQVVMATAGALAAFMKFRTVDAETRRLVMRLLDDPSDTELRALHEQPHGKALADWLLSLPAYLAAPSGHEDSADDRQHPDDEPAEVLPPTSMDLRGDVSRLFHRNASS